jgi:hypothetical protein
MIIKPLMISGLQKMLVHMKKKSILSTSLVPAIGTPSPILMNQTNAAQAQT